MKIWQPALMAIASGLVVLPILAETQGRGEGGIVISDNVPIYFSSDGDRQRATAARGDVVGAESSALAGDFYFVEKNGRVKVTFFGNPEQVGIPSYGWIDPKQLSKFSYDCSCSADKGCAPTRTRGLRGKFTMSSEWNTCFQEARDAHLATLRASNWGQSSGTSNSVQTKTVELNQTTEQVTQILGPPQKILKAGAKVIYVYPDLKITFINGKVTDLQ